MGCLCGKPDPDAFNSPGRVLGSAPPQPRTSAVPKNYTGTTQRLGNSSPDTKTASEPSGRPAGGASDANEARRRAAEAAERRANAASRTPGKLGAQLAAQRKKTTNDHLKDASQQALRERELDANTASLRHD
ncbi:hypothetical protein CFIMG_001316RA [Ceratocystis fimbriata CBS 114723]|uniref:Uncharacterized protein n=1 Tax=Ceratocystis fimbriata CBS 114723 TaxID=1035309 RepID=A0A2C5XET8_9PEZI|nr:hypothetical protein CFIMG_001316RA [Ceratocystis fimbriata CBS 114723]